MGDHHFAGCGSCCPIHGYNQAAFQIFCKWSQLLRLTHRCGYYSSITTCRAAKRRLSLVSRFRLGKMVPSRFTISQDETAHCEEKDHCPLSSSGKITKTTFILIFFTGKCLRRFFWHHKRHSFLTDDESSCSAPGELKHGALLQALY